MPMKSYDIDGVLCEAPTERGVGWGKLNGGQRAAWKEYLLRWYKSARPLLQPPLEEGEFIAITARRVSDPGVSKATSDWIHAQPYGHLCRGIYFLPDEYDKNWRDVAHFKAGVIMANDVIEHIEDNKRIIRIIEKIFAEKGHTTTKLTYFSRPKWERGVFLPESAPQTPLG